MGGERITQRPTITPGSWRGILAPLCGTGRLTTLTWGLVGCLRSCSMAVGVTFVLVSMTVFKAGKSSKTSITSANLMGYLKERMSVSWFPVSQELLAPYAMLSMTTCWMAATKPDGHRMVP